MCNTIHRLALVLALAALPASAQTPPSPPAESPGAQTQRLQQHKLDAENTAGALANLPAQPSAEPETPDLYHLPAETPCFAVRQLALIDNPFAWLPRLAQPVVGQCLGSAGLKQIHDAIANELIARGYVTTRVLLPPQSLAAGTLTLAVAPGRVADIHTEGTGIGWLPAALPTHAGAILDQRDVDQALENIRRLPSQASARFEITPGAQPSDSELRFFPDDGKRWHVSLSADNAGQKTTGKYQLNGALTIDSPLHLYDQLQLSGSANANFGQPDQGTESEALSYSVPFGYAMFTVGANRSRYLQTLAGFDEPIAYSGVQSRLEAGVSGVVFRNASARTELSAKLYHALNHNVMGGVSLEVQARNLWGYELGLAHRQYLGAAQLDGALGWRASLPGMSKHPGTVVGDEAFNGCTEIETANASAMVPFRVFSQPLSYRLSWSMQNARTPLTSPDYFSIGSRYAVRGFDQQLQLAAESGWVLSHELDAYVPTPLGTQALYAGFDVGRVRGPSAQWLIGDTLAGAVIGVRGTLSPAFALGASVSYDVSLGWPVYKPEGFPNQSPTLLFQVSTLF
jgi:hemolysin activation/secretion protein